MSDPAATVARTMTKKKKKQDRSPADPSLTARSLADTRRYGSRGGGMKGPKITLKKAAEELGVAPITLKRWFLDGRVGEVGRDRNGWRVFGDDDLNRLRRF